MANRDKERGYVINTALNPLNANELIDNLVINVINDVPTCVHGEPGIGKSAVVHSLPARLKEATGQDWIMWEDTRLSQIDAVDVHGAPWPNREKGITEFLISSVWPRPDDNRNILLFIDELGQGAPSIQAAIMQLVLERRIGAYHLPKNTRIIAATNMETDRAGVNKLLSPLANRFEHYQLVPDSKVWAEWAIENKIRYEIIAFQRYRPQFFHRFDKNAMINTTARSWERLSKQMDTCHRLGRADLIPFKIKANIDEAVASEFVGFCRQVNEFIAKVDWQSILNDPDNAYVPTEPSVLHMLCGKIINEIDRSNVDALFRYINRMPSEFQVIAVTDMQSRPDKRDVVNSAPFVDWCANNPAAEIGL